MTKGRVVELTGVTGVSVLLQLCLSLGDLEVILGDELVDGVVRTSDVLACTAVA